MVLPFTRVRVASFRHDMRWALSSSEISTSLRGESLPPLLSASRWISFLLVHAIWDTQATPFFFQISIQFFLFCERTNASIPFLPSPLCIWGAGLFSQAEWRAVRRLFSLLWRLSSI